MKRIFLCMHFIMCFLLISVAHSSQNQELPAIGVPVPTITNLRDQPKLMPLREWYKLCHNSLLDDIVAVIGVNRYATPCSGSKEKLFEKVHRKMKEYQAFIDNVRTFQGDFQQEVAKYGIYISIDKWSRGNDGIQQDLLLRQQYRQGQLKRSDVKNRWRKIRDAGVDFQDNTKVYQMLLGDEFKSVGWAEDGYGHTALFCIGRLNDQQQSVNISKVHVAQSQGIANKVYWTLNSSEPEENMARIIDEWLKSIGTDDDNELRRAFIKGQLIKQTVQARSNRIRDLCSSVSTPSLDLQNCLKTYNLLLSETFKDSDWESHLMVQKPEEVSLSSGTCDSYTIIPSTAIKMTRAEYDRVSQRIRTSSQNGGRVIDDYYELGIWGHNCDDAVEALLKGIISVDDLQRIKSSSFARIPLYRLRLSDPERGCWDGFVDRSKDVSMCCVNKTSQIVTCGYKSCW